MTTFHNLTTLAGRIGLAAIFVLSGLTKLGQYAGTQGYMESVGVPGALLPAVIAFEVLGGLAIASGLFTRLAAGLFTGFSVVSAVLFHADFGDQIQTIMFLKNLAIAGGMLLLVAHGAGAWSVDRRLARRDASRSARPVAV